MLEKMIKLVDEARRTAAQKCHSFMACVECKHSVGENPRCRNAYIAESLIANDVIPVVRCKDCKHFIQEEHGCNHFGYYSHTPWVDEVDFCSYGERREGE